MENELKRLKETFDESFLREVKVTQKERERILQKIRKPERSPSHIFYYCSLSATAFLIIILFFSLEINFKQADPNIQSRSGQSNNTDSKETHDTSSENKEEQPHLEETQDYSTFQHIVFEGYYYIKGEQVEQNKIGEKIGEVKRIGTWEIVKDGDSNEVPPGPIYSIKDRDPKEVIAAKQWSNRDVYVIFERKGPVEKTDLSKIMSTKGDVEESKIAFNNIKNKVDILYGFVGLEKRAQLVAISYIDGPLISQTYRILERDINDTQGILNIIQFSKSSSPENSRFVRPKNYEIRSDNNDYIAMQKRIDKWKQPQLIKSIVINDLHWGVYQDGYHNDMVWRTESNNYTVEITYQGSFPIDALNELLNFLKGA
ncbi:hypothetical protein AB5I83_19125 [Mesobacillus sp. LC4]